jgi:hypothetical protein
MRGTLQRATEYDEDVPHWPTPSEQDASIARSYPRPAGRVRHAGAVTSSDLR